MKKFFGVFACVVMILISAFSLTACGGVETNSYITPSTGAVFSGGELKFENANDFSLVYRGKNHYVATGSANVMSDEQASEMGVATGAKFVVLNVQMGKDSTAVVGWRSAETRKNAFEEIEIDGQLIKSITAGNETKNIVLVLSDGVEMNHEGLTIWRIEVKMAESEDVQTYTVDFSSFYEEE